MAEKPKKEEKKHKPHSSKGEISFGLEVLLFVVAVFIIWVLAGGSKKATPESPILEKKVIPTNTVNTINPGNFDSSF